MESVKQLKNEGIIFVITSFVGIVASVMFFYSGEFGSGLICLSLFLILSFMSLLTAIKLHGRYVQLTLCKLHNTTFEELWKNESTDSRNENHD